MFTGGPINLRPYLSKRWLEKGGANEIGVSLGFLGQTLPFMPLGLVSANSQAAVASDPSLSDLLSRKQFFLRCHLVKRQIFQETRNPLLHEIHAMRVPARLEMKKSNLLEWRDIEKHGRQEIQTIAPPGTKILSFLVTTMGNVRSVLSFSSRQY